MATCRQTKCLIRGKVDEDLRICYRMECNRDRIVAQAQSECKDSAMANYSPIDLNDNCKPMWPLTGLQKQCVRVRCSETLAVSSRRICAMNSCNIQLKNSAACFDAKFQKCEAGKRWSVAAVGCVDARIKSPVIRNRCDIDHVVSKRTGKCIHRDTVCSDDRYAYSAKAGKCMIKPAFAWGLTNKCPKGSYSSK